MHIQITKIFHREEENKNSKIEAIVEEKIVYAYLISIYYYVDRFPIKFQKAALKNYDMIRHVSV